VTYEVELKFPVPDLQTLRRHMERIGACPGETIEQVDTYLAHPVRQFAETDEAFRIRAVGEENRLTYKGPLVDPLAKTRREIEVRLESGAAVFGKTLEMLRLLGFRVVREVRKRRTGLTLHYAGRDVELTLDDVAGLGTFAELETLVEDDQTGPARDDLLRLADELGLSGQERRSYLQLLIEQEGLPAS
jgi:adenylate cyclase class 2